MVRYLYLDDEASADAFAEAVSTSDEVEITTEPPMAFEAQLGDIAKRSNILDGIILDWRLDQKSTVNGKARFRAGSLAQELRTLGTEDKIPEMPIVLWSTEQRLSKSYTGDVTSHDLFDRLYKKDEIVKQLPRVQAELVALVQGYQRIRDERAGPRKFQRLLQLDDVQFGQLDPRLANRFAGRSGVPAHEFSRFLLKGLLEVPGPLVAEELLAARLGIDIGASPDWVRLLLQIPEEAKYSGPFASAWRRWWWHTIDRTWWPSLAANLRPLSVLEATERVAILRRYTRLKRLVAAEPVPGAIGFRYWTICESSRRPLDPADGVVLDNKSLEPWQDRRYISLGVAADPWRARSYHIDPREVGRVKEYRSLLNNVEDET